MIDRSDPISSSTAEALDYWSACCPDAPIALVPFECCARFVCRCERIEEASPQEPENS